MAIARALAAGPDLVIADEPTASLDPAAGREVMDLFSTLVASRGATLIYTSHDMDHAAAFSDRIVALGKGGLLFDRASQDVSRDALSEVFDG